MFLLDGKEVEPNVLEFDRVGLVKSFKMTLEHDYLEFLRWSF